MPSTLTKALHTAEEIVVGTLLVTMTLLIFFEILIRMFYEQINELVGTTVNIFWMEEATLHVAAWFVLFGASYGIRVGAHIGVDAVVKNLRPALRKLTGLLVAGGGLLYCALLGYGAWIYLAKVKKIGVELDDLPIPKWQAHSILFIGMILLAIRLAEIAWGILRGRLDGFTLADEVKEVMDEASISAQKSEAGR